MTHDRKSDRLNFNRISLIKNVVCDGAEKAIFIRGLPKMNIRDIKFDNVIINAKSGIECSEAKNIQFSNVKVIITKEDDPAIDILNSSNIFFYKMAVPDQLKNAIRIGGDRSNNIKWMNSKANRKEQIAFEFGATEKTFIVQ